MNYTEMVKRADRDAGYWRTGGLWVNVVGVILLVVAIVFPHIPGANAWVSSVALVLYVAFEPLATAKQLLEAADEIDIAIANLKESDQTSQNEFIESYRRAKVLARGSIVAKMPGTRTVKGQ